MHLLTTAAYCRFVLNKSLWALESEVKQIGGLIYW
jgi:hypothetical protein